MLAAISILVPTPALAIPIEGDGSSNRQNFPWVHCARAIVLVQFSALCCSPHSSTSITRAVKFICKSLTIRCPKRNNFGPSPTTCTPMSQRLFWPPTCIGIRRVKRVCTSNRSLPVWLTAWRNSGWWLLTTKSLGTTLFVWMVSGISNFLSGSVLWSNTSSLFLMEKKVSNVVFYLPANVDTLREKLSKASSKRSAHPSRLSMSPVVENKSEYSFPEDEKLKRKLAKVAKVSYSIPICCALCLEFCSLD